MQFSRSHAGMLAVVSIFTGIIAPVGSYLGVGTPLPLTDKQWIAYAMLALLVIIFYLVSIGSWKRMRIFSYTLIALILSVFYLSMSGNLENIRTGYTLTTLSWGWIFFSAGGVLLLGTIIFDYEEFSPVSSMSDKIVGLVGSITLLCLSLVIMMISLVWPPRGHDGKSILSEVFDSGIIESRSGVLLSPAFQSITGVTFDRKTDSLSFEGISLDGQVKTEKSFSIRNRHIVLGENKTVILDGIIQSGTLAQLFSEDQSIAIQVNTSLRFITLLGDKSFTGKTSEFVHITKDTSNKTFAWGEKSASGYTISKNGDTVGDTLSGIDRISLSTSGYDLMVKGTSASGTTMIIKNGTILENMREGYIRGTYQSNGSHSLYVIAKEGGYRIVYDGSIIQGDFEEVRETFLEKSGNSYGYFARPLGEKRYCLFTRYRGNICGLDGYMNPQLSADGGSILFAGLKEGTWSIYRNTGIVIRESGYTKRNIGDDYVFLDITNPRQYLFIEKNEDGSYALRKNGKLVPGTWQDVGLDATFGYDNKIIMTAKDATGWRIIEF